MRVTIENFANIRKATIVLEKGKFNFIYGISGSGKTSIANAILNRNNELDNFKTFGSSDETHVNIDDESEFKVFNESAIKEFVFDKMGIGIYDVIYGDNEELRIMKKEIQDFLERQDFRDILSIVSKYEEQINTLEKTLGLQKTSTGNLSKKGLFGLITKPKDYVTDVPNISQERKLWIRNGYGFISDKRCPFCEQPIAEKIIEIITKIVNELPEELNVLLNSQSQLKTLGIELNVNDINIESEQLKLKNCIQEKYIVLKELKEIREYLDFTIKDDKELSRNSKVKISQFTSELFSEVDIDIINLFDKLSKDKEGYIETKKRYNSKFQYLIRQNIIKINEYITLFGINYKFTKDNILNRNNNYSLVHIQSDSDSSSFLSTGERNIIALILFLISYDQFDLIIDDPASSFDEYRREQILSFLIKRRYKDGGYNKTTLVLSHDQVFLKFLAFNYMKNRNYSQYIGNVFHFDNKKGLCNCVNIMPKDMNYLLVHIKGKCTASDSYIQKILNLRLYFELYDAESIEYKYCSAILHFKRDELTCKKLQELIKQENTDETSILLSIKKITGISLLKFDPSNTTCDSSNFSNFEKLCLIREMEQISTNERKEMNSIVHFNYAMQHLLNPYSFDFQSSGAYEILNTYKDKTDSYFNDKK